MINGEVTTSEHFTDSGDLLIDQEISDLLGGAVTESNPWEVERTIRQRIDRLKKELPEKPGNQEVIDLLETNGLVRIDRLKTLEAYEQLATESERWQEVIDLVHERALVDQSNEAVRALLMPFFVRLNLVVSESIEADGAFGPKVDRRELVFLAKQRLLEQLITAFRVFPPPSVSYGRRRATIGSLIQHAVGARQPEGLALTVNRFVEKVKPELLARQLELQQQIPTLEPADIIAVVGELTSPDEESILTAPIDRPPSPEFLNQPAPIIDFVVPKLQLPSIPPPATVTNLLEGLEDEPSSPQPPRVALETLQPEALPATPVEEPILTAPIEPPLPEFFNQTAPTLELDTPKLELPPSPPVPGMKELLEEFEDEPPQSEPSRLSYETLQSEPLSVTADAPRLVPPVESTEAGLPFPSKSPALAEQRAQIQPVESIKPPRPPTGRQFFIRTRKALATAFNRRTRALMLAGLIGGTSLIFRKEIGQSVGPLAQELRMKLQPKLASPESVYQELTQPISEPVRIERSQLIEDKAFVTPGSVVHTTDLLYRINQLSNELFDGHAKPNPETLVKYRNTVKLLESAKEVWPQAVRFRFVNEDNKLTLEPLDWQENVKIKQDVQADITVVGGEIESIVGAISAAKVGQRTVLLYLQGKLGGLNSDTGANLAYFDGMNRKNVHPPVELVEIFQEGLHMSPTNIISIPNNDLEQKLLAFLKKKYPTITLVPTRTFNSIHVATGLSGQHQLVTEEGVRLTGKVLDTHPEAIVAEKMGLPISPETINLSYGLVFDVNGLNPELMVQSAKTKPFHPDRILEKMGIDKTVLQRHPELQSLYDRAVKADGTGTFREGEASFGYQGLSQGFQFYMKLRQYREANPTTRIALERLNVSRVLDGFNIAHHENNRLTLNSISYRGDMWHGKRVLQGDHNLYRDPQFGSIRDIEAPALRDYFRLVYDNSRISIGIPPELYVRQQSSHVQTLAPRTLNEMSIEPKGDPYNSFLYGFDLRGYRQRDAWDKTGILINKAYNIAHGKPFYSQGSARHAITKIPGLYVVNKNSLEQETYGATRLQQALALDIRAAVTALPQNKIELVAAHFRTDSPYLQVKFNPLGPLVAALPRPVLRRPI